MRQELLTYAGMTGASRAGEVDALRNNHHVNTRIRRLDVMSQRICRHNYGPNVWRRQRGLLCRSVRRIVEIDHDGSTKQFRLPRARSEQNSNPRTLIPIKRAPLK
jgi:hypothetical protein